jgi:hypothetical protein
MKFKLTRAQAEIVDCPARYMFLAAGRRWGKTLTAKTRLVARALRMPRWRAWYITPVYSQCKEVYESITEEPALQRFIRRTRLQPYPVIDFWNRSSIGFRSFEKPKTLRGSGLHEVWVDEIQDIPEGPFWPVIRPLISDRRGNLIISGQFRGHNWYYKRFYLPGTGAKRKPQYQSWRYPSSTGLAFRGAAGRAELAESKAQVPPAVWDQEYECVPSANIACVFPPDQIDACIGGAVITEPVEGRHYGLGVDLGRVVDPTAIVAMDDLGLVCHSEGLPLRTKHAIAARHVGRLAQYWGGAITIVDTTGGATGGKTGSDEHVKFYRKWCKTMRSFAWTPANKEAVIASLGLAVQSGAIAIPPSHAELIEQLRAYEYSYRAGVYRYSAPDGSHDDFVAAIAQANWGRTHGWFTPSGSVLGLVG